MRLLNTSTLELDSFASVESKGRRMYAILSHTWEDEEILFDDVKHGPLAIPRHKKGFAKVEGSARYAKEQGLDWIWIDTCCIDKSSSAELSEAINSMFLWYARARVCFAYLSDVKSPEELASSRWFTRGWTLQELLAPLEVEFLDSSWRLMGIRTEMAKTLSEITRVDELLLLGHHDIDTYSVSTRMGWASRRETTREEDLAYSLLGIFKVNLPLLYGEGLARAFSRLQEEIIKVSSDQSIFVFRSYELVQQHVQDIWGLTMGYHLARRPSQFQLDDPVIDDDPYERSYAALHPITLDTHCVTFRAWIGPATYHIDRHTSTKAQLVILNCCFESDPLARPAFLVTNFDGLLVRLKAPLLRAVPVTLPVPEDSEGSLSAIEVVVDNTDILRAKSMQENGGRVEAAHMAEFSEQLVTISQPYNKDSRPHLGLCRISNTSKYLVAKHDHVVKPHGGNYEQLQGVFGHLGSISVTGLSRDPFHILWGYAKDRDTTDRDSPDSDAQRTSHIQYFGRRSVDAWRDKEPRCVITGPERKRRPQPERILQNLGPDCKWRLPGTYEREWLRPTLGPIRSPKIRHGGPPLSPGDLSSWVISRRPSGLVFRVDVRLRTFLSRTCVEVEISDCPPDTETIPTTLRLAAPEPPVDTHPDHDQHIAPEHTQDARNDSPSERHREQLGPSPVCPAPPPDDPQFKTQNGEVSKDGIPMTR